MDPSHWNELHRPGTAVWAVNDAGSAFLTVTSTEAAWDPEAGCGMVSVFGADTARRLDQVVIAHASQVGDAHRAAVRLAVPGWTWFDGANGSMVGRIKGTGVAHTLYLQVPGPVAGLALIVDASSAAAAAARLAAIAERERES